MVLYFTQPIFGFIKLAKIELGVNFITSWIIFASMVMQSLREIELVSNNTFILSQYRQDACYFGQQGIKWYMANWIFSYQIWYGA